MDTVSVLDGYLRKAVNPNNSDLDVSSIDLFCLTLKKDPSKMSAAAQLLASRIQSSNTREALLALEALEECMETLGEEFRCEINKFRFLNELIRLVSKNHSGHKTPREVSERILNILLTWTNKYEHCVKIQEAYNSLKTQGVEHHPQQNVVVRNTSRTSNRTSEVDKEQIRLKQLISSGKREDLEKANLLIQNFYRDDERRTQMKHRRFAELQKVTENTKLLEEMLAQYQPERSSDDELAIIREIYESCESAHPTIVRLAEETQQSEEMLEKIFQVNDSLTQVLDRYRELILNVKPLNVDRRAPAADSNPATNAAGSSSSRHSASGVMNIVGPDLLDTLLDVSSETSGPGSAATETRSTFDDLSDISFTVGGNVAPAVANDEILAPQILRNVSNATARPSQPAEVNGIDKYNEVKDLFNLPSAAAPFLSIGMRPKPVSLETMKKAAHNSAVKADAAITLTAKTIPDLDSIVTGMKTTLLSESSAPVSAVVTADKTIDCPQSSCPDADDCMLVASEPASAPPDLPDQPTVPPKQEFKSLAEIVVDLDSIQPSSEPSRTVLDDKDGLQITLNFSVDHPRPDVTVIVISTTNQGRTPIPSFHFDASVRKPCKLRLLPASGTSLPGTKPFRPPADGVTQVLLLANPTGEPVDLTCILSYCVGDDPDPIKESIVMRSVPFVRD